MVNIEEFIATFILSLVVGTISMTISKSILFRKLQDSYPLIQCPYCVGHWIALPLFLIYQPIVIEYIYLIDLIVSYFVLICLASLSQLVIGRLFVLLDNLSDNH